MRDFRELKVWRKGHQLALEIYEATAGLPRQEPHGLTAQLRRSCASIPANIAEGRGGSDDAKLARFMQTAMGSASELEYRLLPESQKSFREYDRSKARVIHFHEQTTFELTSSRPKGGHAHGHTRQGTQYLGHGGAGAVCS
ncbi:MAG: four helix bundle protein [Actinomycetota bacterium]|nr:four helix bundle protein [Actinomycetota bacterium]